MNKRRANRFVASIFAAALLFAVSGAAPFAASPVAVNLSTNSAEAGDDNGNGVVCTGELSKDRNTCTISHANPTGNRDECSLFSTRPDVTQRCIITQTSVAGDNRVHVRMRIAQEKTAALPNTGACSAFPSRTLPNSNQNGCQILTLTQTSASGSNSLNAVLRITQEIDEGSAPQRQNAGQQHRVDQCSGSRTSVPPCVGPGTNLAKLRLFQRQEEEAEAKADQFQRSTGGEFSHHSTITQKSTGISRYDRKFMPHQVQEAPAGSTQIQDPDDWCCSPQVTNPANFANDNTIVTSSSNCMTGSSCDQRDNITGDTRGTSGTGTVFLSVTNNNGVPVVQSCSAQGGCSRSIFVGGEGPPTGAPIR